MLMWAGVAIAIITGMVFVWWQSRNESGTPSISRLSTNDFHALTFSPNEADTVFFGHHGGLLVSRDGGRSWQPTSLQNTDAMALAAPPANPQIMYAAGHDVFVKSADGGETWQAVPHNLPGTDIHGFAVDSQNADYVFASVVGAGLWSSRDGGMTWQSLSPDAPRSTFNLAVGETSQTLYAAAGQAGLWRSADGGGTWSALPNVPDSGAVTVAFDVSQGRLYVTTAGNEAGLYFSNDEGVTWTASSLKGTLLALAVSPLAPQHVLVVAEGGRVFASRDSGITWSGN